MLIKEKLLNRTILLALITLCSMPLLADESKKYVTLVGDKDSYIEAEICFIDNIPLSKSITDYSSAISVLNEFISGLKNGKTVNNLVKDKTKEWEKLLPMPKRFYTEQRDIKYTNAFLWGRYMGIGVQYIYTDKNVPWREDFFCEANYKDCLLDFGFAIDPENEIYENIYYMIVNGHVNDHGISSEQADRIKLKKYSGNEDSVDRCPILLNYRLTDVNEKLCLDCKELNNQIRKIKNVERKRLISSVVSNILDIKKGNTNKILTKTKSNFIRTIGINGQESIVGIENFVSYISSWENINLLGYLKEKDVVNLFIEYNFAPKKHGKLEMLRFKQGEDSFTLDANPEIAIGNKILYSNYFIDAINKKYKLIDVP